MPYRQVKPRTSSPSPLLLEEKGTGVEVRNSKKNIFS
jgi:hypothetical protein